MERTLLDDVIRTDYGQFDIVWAEGAGFAGDWEQVFKGQANGLVGAADPGGVYVGLARRSGGSRVQIVLLDSQPPLADAYYEDVVEASVSVPAGSVVQWMSWAGESWGALSGLDPGTYRLRVSAHGRDAGAQGEFADGVVDEYLLQFWPAAAEADEILRIGSENAKYWHREVGGRR